MPTLQPRRDLPDMSAEMVASRRFGQSWRGYDQEEVKQFLAEVADQLRALRERAEAAEAARREAEERAAHPRLDEATLMSALGEETAKILQSAHNAAAEVLARAERTAERTTAEAQAKADELMARAESLLAERTAEAEQAAAEVLEQARAEADGLLARAREQAAAQHEEATRKSEELVHSAQEARERILGDLARRRRLATVQIEQLRAGRERLLAAYLTVRQTLDEVTEELQRADAEARAAADAVGRQHAQEAKELGGGHSEDIWASAGQDEPPPQVVLAPKAGELAARESERRPDQAPPALRETDRKPGAERAPAGAWAPGPKEPRAALVNAAEEFESVRILRPASEPSGTGQDPVTGQVPAPAGPPAGRQAGLGEAALAPERSEQGDGDVAGAGLGEAALTPERGEQGPPRLPANQADVDDLFARIKASRAEATSRARRALEGSNGRKAPARPTRPTQGPAGGAEAQGELELRGQGAEPEGTSIEQESEGLSQLAAVAEAGEGTAATPEAVFFAERDQLTGRLEAALARKLKRVLQDEQNALLDQLRNLKGRPEEVLPDTAEHPGRFAQAGRPLLEEAVRGGIQLVARAYGPSPSAVLSADAVDDLAFELGRAIAEPLRDRLEQALRAGGEGSELAEALGAAYREWKTQRIEEAARDQVAAAFSRGAYLALPEGAKLRWVVDATEGPCPDCEDNALAAELVKGEPWPTGQLYPPAHPGCRCAILPHGATGPAPGGPALGQGPAL